ncbi:hypothetical protein AKUH4B504J_02330 [Apilactobacillus kunkeei]|uniref:hypothetical protein n=1 Tax=Apilactobacillus kunkeei TaxID=148814 RepID=UPI0021E31E13|nr:hypothetical protein AKUH4B504J_02330 [Apilactobacillus kunkeei]
MKYNKRKIRKLNDKKMLKKVKKNWVVVSVSSFALFGAAGLTLMTTQVSANADGTTKGKAATIMDQTTYSSSQSKSPVVTSNTSSTSSSQGSSNSIQDSSSALSENTSVISSSNVQSNLDTNNSQSSNSNNSLTGVSLSEAQAIIDQMASSAQSNIDSNAAVYRDNLAQGLSYRDNFSANPISVYFNDVNGNQPLG